MGATLVRPVRRDEPGRPLWLPLIRQRIESVFFTLKDLLSLERHGARTLENLRTRIATRLLAPCDMRLAQPPTRQTEPLARGLHRLSTWNQSSSVGAPVAGQRVQCVASRPQSSRSVVAPSRTGSLTP